MRTFVLVVALLAPLLMLDPGGFGGLMVLGLLFLLLRGVWLFSGDLQRMGSRRR